MYIVHVPNTDSTLLFNYTLVLLYSQKSQQHRGGKLSRVVSVGCGIYPPSPIGHTDVPSLKNLWKAPSNFKSLLLLFFTAVRDTLFVSSYLDTD